MKKWIIPCVLLGLVLLGQEQPIKIEAEEVVVNKEAIIKDKMRPDLWTYWTTDKDAEKKWSGCGIVLKSPEIMADRKTPEEGAPPLHIVIPLPSEGPWTIKVVGPARLIGFSRDNIHWTPIHTGVLVTGFTTADRKFECWFDDRFVNDSSSKGSTYLDYFLLEKTATNNKK